MGNKGERPVEELMKGKDTWKGGSNDFVNEAASGRGAWKGWQQVDGLEKKGIASVWKDWQRMGGQEKSSTNKVEMAKKGSGKGKDNGKAGKGWQQRNCHGEKKGSGKGADKFQCQIFLDIEEESKFKVVRRVLGVGGENMKRIAQESGAKLRLRGRGSKFLEGPEQKESDDELMLCISSEDSVGFELAKSKASALIEDIHRHYISYCRKAGHHC